MNYRYFLILAILLLGCASTKKVDKINSKFKDSNCVEDKYVGLVGTPSKMYQDFTELWLELNEEEKIELAKNGALAPKFYASLQLVDSKSDKIFDVFKENIKDKKPITYLSGCVEKPTEISLEMLSSVKNKIESKKEDSLSSKKSLEILLKRKKELIEIEKTDKSYRPGFKDYLDDQIKMVKDFENWTLGELVVLQKLMSKEIKKNEYSSEALIKMTQ